MSVIYLVVFTSFLPPPRSKSIISSLSYQMYEIVSHDVTFHIRTDESLRLRIVQVKETRSS